MNKWTGVGRLGKDPELVSTNSGTKIAKFSIATTDGFGDNKETNWHNIVVFGKQADPVAQYLSKGSLAGVVGRIKYRNYDNKQGQKVYVTEIIADHVEFLSSDKGGQSRNTETPFEEEAPFEATDDDIAF
jgi:single-strand DNA-binding protein